MSDSLWLETKSRKEVEKCFHGYITTNRFAQQKISVGNCVKAKFASSMITSNIIWMVLCHIALNSIENILGGVTTGNLTNIGQVISMSLSSRYTALKVPHGLRVTS